MEDHGKYCFREHTNPEVCLTCGPQKSSPPLLPQPRAGNPPFAVCWGLCVRGLPLHVFINLSATCPSFQKLLNLLVSCVQDNWIWELNLQFVIENGNMVWLQIRTHQHITSVSWRHTNDGLSSRPGYPNIPPHGGHRALHMAVVVLWPLLPTPGATLVSMVIGLSFDWPIL